MITKENLNKAVFTLKSITEAEKSILYVVHDNDDEWQFLSGEPVFPKDMMIVSLQQIIDIDGKIMEILNLGKGFEASRVNVNSKWLISKYE